MEGRGGAEKEREGETGGERDRDGGREDSRRVMGGTHWGHLWSDGGDGVTRGSLLPLTPVYCCMQNLWSET